MAQLGGSPLGLINLRSLPTSDGMSTFNGGPSRKISVNSYNNATAGKVGVGSDGKTTYDGTVGTRSLFSGSPSASLAPYGNIGKLGTTDGGGMDMSGPYKGIRRSNLHNNTVYDTSLLNIIEQLAGTQGELRPADFAYLKDVGVFPNNRLMIARRFLSPHNDNIYVKGAGTGQPSAIMISWKPQGEDFVSITFGEKWEEAKGDFKDVLDALGEDFLGKTLGQKIGGGLAVVPLPGFTEAFQKEVLVQMGVLNADGLAPLPAGNPNLIKMAKRRQTVASETAGSGLNCSISVTMNCEWEQKFISGIDPTIAWQDIIAKILTFATSRSNTYGLTAQFEKTASKWMNNPETILKDMIGFIKLGLNAAKESIQQMIDGFKETLAPTETDPKKQKDAAAKKVKTENEIKAANLKKLASVTADTLIQDALDLLSKQLNKYRIAIEGIARALSGMPSTPWHITIGNPLRPIFVSGDMYMEQDLKLDLGPTLAFNDLPTSIKATFTLTNARPWGLQEIAGKFNTGSIRVATIVKDTNDLNHGETLKDQIYVTPTTGSATNPNNSTAATGAVATAVANGAAATGTTVPTTAAQVTPGIPTPPVTTKSLGTTTTNLTAGATTNLSNAQNDLDKVTAAVNSGEAQAQGLAAKAAAAAASSVDSVTGAVTGAVGAATGAVTGALGTGVIGTAVANGVSTVGANVGTNISNAVSTTKWPPDVLATISDAANFNSVSGIAPPPLPDGLKNIDFTTFLP